MRPPLEVSTLAKEGLFQGSKARKIPFLVDSEEMEDLFEELGDFSLFDVSRPVAAAEMELSKDRFLALYAEYAEGIKSGKLANERPLRPFFSAVLTIDPSVLYAQEVGEGRYLVKARGPVVQFQRHHFVFSEGFYSGVMGQNSITWGIQCLFPKLFLDPKTHEICKVAKTDAFPNAYLFDRFSKWIRCQTLPTPFLVDGKRVNQPIRLGKGCFSWINNHPSLSLNHLKVDDVAFQKNS